MNLHAELVSKVGCWLRAHVLPRTKLTGLRPKQLVVIPNASPKDGQAVQGFTPGLPATGDSIASKLKQPEQAVTVLLVLSPV